MKFKALALANLSQSTKKLHLFELRTTVTSRRVVRIWKRGGLFWKSEKCANDLASNFHWSWISFRRFVRILRRNVSRSSEIQRFFLPKIRWSPKKKKVFTKIEAAISSNFANSDVWGGLFSIGEGLFSIFHIKSASKAQKACDFAYFTSQWGGLESPPAPPPPPPLATLLVTSHTSSAII